jgi:hypothetical protein
VDVAPFGEDVEQIGLECGHDGKTPEAGGAGPGNVEVAFPPGHAKIEKGEGKSRLQQDRTGPQRSRAAVYQAFGEISRELAIWLN